MPDVQALDVVLALLDPLPAPADSSVAPDSPQSTTELHTIVGQHVVQVRLPGGSSMMPAAAAHALRLPACPSSAEAAWSEPAVTLATLA